MPVAEPREQRKEIPKARRPMVRASYCPVCSSGDTYVASTQDRTRYCKCRTCTATWKQHG